MWDADASQEWLLSWGPQLTWACCRGAGDPLHHVPRSGPLPSVCEAGFLGARMASALFSTHPPAGK